jgi:hypothetical protein
MPVMFAAVARRLDYPVKLVITRAHVFCRWDGQHHPNSKSRDRFNIEATNNGMNSFPDEYYMTWPHRITPAEVTENRYLVSLSAAEELAGFLASRGHCLLDTGHTKDAFSAYSAAHRLAPQWPAHLAWAQEAQWRLAPSALRADPHARRGSPPNYRRDSIRDVEWVDAINRANQSHSQPAMPGVDRDSAPPRWNMGTQAHLPSPQLPQATRIGRGPVQPTYPGAFHRHTLPQQPYDHRGQFAPIQDQP